MTRFATLLLCSWSCAALTLQTEANPIRKVVTILQDMQKEIEAEGDKERDLCARANCCDEHVLRCCMCAGMTGNPSVNK